MTNLYKGELDLWFLSHLELILYVYFAYFSFLYMDQKTWTNPWPKVKQENNFICLIRTQAGSKSEQSHSSLSQQNWQLNVFLIPIFSPDNMLSVFSEGNFKVISCLWLWIIRWSSVGKRCWEKKNFSSWNIDWIILFFTIPRQIRNQMIEVTVTESFLLLKSYCLKECWMSYCCKPPALLKLSGVEI